MILSWKIFISARIVTMELLRRLNKNYIRNRDRLKVRDTQRRYPCHLNHTSPHKQSQTYIGHKTGVYAADPVLIEQRKQRRLELKMDSVLVEQRKQRRLELAREISRRSYPKKTSGNIF